MAWRECAALRQQLEIAEAENARLRAHLRYYGAACHHVGAELLKLADGAPSPAPGP